MHPYDGRVISNFILQALNNEPITIYGDGLQTRSFCYVDDLIDGMIKMMHSPDDFVGPVNMGNPHERSILEIAGLIVDMTNSQSELTFKPLPKNDPVRRRPDISLAKERLHWEPRISLENGLINTIEYFERMNKELLDNSKRTYGLAKTLMHNSIG